MVARHFYRNDAGTLVEVTQYLKRADWETREGAEEGQSESSTLRFYDPEMVLDFVPHRRYIIFEDESEDANQVIYSGFVQMDDVARGDQEIEPLGRVIVVTLNDMNTLFDNRLMVGGTDRDEETDVERVTWVAESEEMGYFEDLTMVSSASPVTLDARDVAGQSSRQIFDEAAEDSDKNYWIGCYGEIGDTSIFLWYGKPTLGTYVSPLTLLSNDPGDWSDDDLADGTSTVWPISDDTKRHRTGERIYSGVLVEYEGGRKYRKKAATLAYFTLSGRDLAHPAPEIKSEARAGRRATRLLNRLDDPEITIKTTVELPAAKASMLRAGMLVPFKATHIDEVATGRTCRILNATHRPIAAGARYAITMELEPVGSLAASACALIGVSVTESGTFAPLNGATSRADGMVVYLRPGITYPTAPAPSYVGAWHFPEYGTGGGTDFAGDFTENTVRIFVAGPGTITIHTATYSGGTRYLDAGLWHLDPVSGMPDQDAAVDASPTSTDIVFTVPDDGHCYHWVDVTDDHTIGGGKWGFSGYTWVGAE